MEVVNMRDHNLQNDQNYIKKLEQTTLLQETIQTPSTPPPPTTASPPSSSTSPTHEFSFTISLNPNPPSKSTQDSHKYHTTHINNKNDYHNHHHHHHSITPPPEPLTAIDLSPADDIFFHGHLLPLHLLSHLPVSPRSSTNSMDSFTLPTNNILKDHNNHIGNTSFHYHHRNTFSEFNLPNNNVTQTRPKSKSFSIFSRPKWKKGSLDEKEVDHDNNQDQERHNSSKKKLKQEVAQLIKRYMKMVRPFMSFTKAKRPNTEFNQQPHSFSGNLVSSRTSLPLEMNRSDRKRGKYSAPVSMRTSPTNSGILLASGTASPAISTTSDSTMEELQAAIQAAIAHCKNSIAIEDKVQA